MKIAKAIFQKAATNKPRYIMLAVIDEEHISKDSLPSIFECQLVLPIPTIYTGTYPTIRINTDTIEERADLIGLGIEGITTGEGWYCSDRPDSLVDEMIKL